MQPLPSRTVCTVHWTLPQVMGLELQIGRIHLAQNKTTTSLCWSHNTSSLPIRPTQMIPSIISPQCPSRMIFSLERLTQMVPIHHLPMPHSNDTHAPSFLKEQTICNNYSSQNVPLEWSPHTNHPKRSPKWSQSPLAFFASFISSDH